jgi:hypothetical protein
MIALNGATSLAFNTTVQPAASAGASLDVIWLSGQFQGVIRPHTPIGSRRMSVSPINRSNLYDLRTETISVKWPSALIVCISCEKVIGEPISAVIARANSPPRASNPLTIRRSKASRSLRLVAA